MDASYKRNLYAQIQKGGPGCLCLFSQMAFCHIFQYLLTLFWLFLCNVSGEVSRNLFVGFQSTDPMQIIVNKHNM